MIVLALFVCLLLVGDGAGVSVSFHFCGESPHILTQGGDIMIRMMFKY